MIFQITLWGIFLVFVTVVSSGVFTNIHNFIYEELSAAQYTSSLKILKTPHEKFILYEVPFISQAPLGDWSDPREQHGCEEASALMAMGWVLGKTFTPEQALEEIIFISDFEFKRYGEFRDTSAEDTAERIFKGYFKYDPVGFKKDIGVGDIKRELYRGNLVIVPVNGQKLGNPFFKPPGPIQHMVVVKGYDPRTKEFITNDPGTKHGESFRYKEEILEKALQDYPTGFHRKILKIETAMIVASLR